MQWTDVLNPTSVISPLLISTSITVGMTYDPIPKNDLLMSIEQDHNIERGKPFQGKLVVVQDQEAPRIYVGGMHADGPLVKVDLSAVTLREARGDNALLDKFCYVFIGSAHTKYGAQASAEFELCFDTEVAFWAFASLLASENMLFHQFFQRPGIRYRDPPAPLVPAVPMPRWIRVEILLAIATLGLLPSYLVLALVILFFSLV
ncbi:hypothetical protein HYPSUDRAFT_200933 [Hypholoma sublateritium FD-334 SS-4]|uniref:Transmembrane protein n=1 Tax=Hypholoma sublateritium (strain FD-334 SS-4) TaxID=945553 RepID=A0A0D2PXH8_HYPSF|nr:hypothetical protein HYPSUDRAFT_200933 [Hypholoma sublateritium FD-334 SS-4]